MTTLRDLLEQAKQLHGVRSGSALAKIAEHHGHTANRTTLNHLLAGSYRSEPSPALLRGIAFLAQVDVGTVYDAAGQPRPGKPFADELPPNVDHLRPHHRRAVVEVIRGFLVDVERDQLWEEVGGLMSDHEVALFTQADDAVDGLHRVLDYRGGLTAAEIAGSGLPTMAAAREARHLRDLEAAQMQEQAAYDDDDQGSGSDEAGT